MRGGKGCGKCIWGERSSNCRLTVIPGLPLPYIPMQLFGGEAGVTPGCEHGLGFQHDGEKLLERGNDSLSDDPIQEQIPEVYVPVLCSCG